MNPFFRNRDLPAMVIHRQPLMHNISAMSLYCKRTGVQHAPHIKTTMAPKIWDLQRAAGAGALTIATTEQAKVLAHHGVPRILMANLLVDEGAIEWVANTCLSATSTTEFQCYVDSTASVELLESRLQALQPDRSLQVLIEVGFAGGRTGVRSLSQAVDVAQAVARSRWLSLAGVAAFEGLMPGRDLPDRVSRVARFLATVRETVNTLHASGQLTTPSPLVTAGGSSFYDLVVDALGPRRFKFPVTTVIRAGCYVVHDHGLYQRTSPPHGKNGLAALPNFRPALELIASVLSCPEPRVAVVGFGRRNVPTDDTLPVVLGQYSADGTRSPLVGSTVTAVNDQHAFLHSPAPLRPGDVLGFGVSHPCGAFDRWRSLPLVTDNLQVVNQIETLF